MGEVVNVIVAFAVIVILFRWATSSKSFRSLISRGVLICGTGNESPEERSASASLGFRPKNVTQNMVRTTTSVPLEDIKTIRRLIPQVDTIHGMFPDIPA